MILQLTIAQQVASAPAPMPVHVMKVWMHSSHNRTNQEFTAFFYSSVAYSVAKTDLHCT